MSWFVLSKQIHTCSSGVFTCPPVDTNVSMSIRELVQVPERCSRIIIIINHRSGPRCDLDSYFEGYI